MTNSPPRGPAVILGTQNTFLAKPMQTLSAKIGSVSDRDGIQPGTGQVTWFRNGQPSGVTGFHYSVSKDDLGRQISYLYSYTDGNGKEESIWSSRPVLVRDEDMRRVALVYDLAFGLSDPDIKGWLFWTEYYRKLIGEGKDRAEAAEELIAAFRQGGLYEETLEKLNGNR